MTGNETIIILAKGTHSAPGSDCGNPERCFWEWHNWITRRRHTASCPPGVSPILHAYAMQLNDVLPDGRRQELRRFLPDGEDRFAGTAHDGLDETRGYFALDWLIRTYTPAWLDFAGLSAEAQALRDLRRITDLVAARSAGPVVRAGRDKAATARDAAWAAAGHTAWAAAWHTAGGAAWATAGDAARDAAGDAAGGAARAAAGAAAWAAAWHTAGGTAGDAARVVAWAGDKLAAGVARLQDSAIALLDIMITAG